MSGYGCPFCGERINWTFVVEELLLRAFEGHLDRHMARGDQLLAQKGDAHADPQAAA